MSRLPVLVSLPHGGLDVPPEVADLCTLSAREIQRDGDEGAREIYTALGEQAEGFVTTDVARAIVDLNRAEEDRRRDGVVKTHTCWDVPVYRRFPDDETVEVLLERYHRPYHRVLESGASGGQFLFGLDCHTMAASGPPVGPDPGSRRPLVCLSNAEGTCPAEWLDALGDRFREALETDDVRINDPFRGGHIIRRHGGTLPWIQLELSRTAEIGHAGKATAVLDAISRFTSHVEHRLLDHSRCAMTRHR